MHGYNCFTYKYGDTALRNIDFQKYRSIKKSIALAASILLTSQAQAQVFDWAIVATPTYIEGSYMPTKVNFQINQAAGTCAAGAWLTWNAKGTTADEKSANTAAILSMIMTAKVANRSLTVIGNNSGCTVDFLYLN
jgi:hypothetical protein